MSAEREALLDAYIRTRESLRKSSDQPELRGLEASVLAANEGLVVMAASARANFVRHDDGFEDLLQEGRLALLESMRRYQPSGGASLATFAMYRIRDRMAVWSQERSSSIRVPRTQQRLARKFERAADAQAERGAGTSGDQAIVATFAVRVATVRRTRLAGRMTRPARLLHGPQDDRAPIDLPAPSEQLPEALVVAAEISAVLSGGVDGLPPREREIVERTYGLCGRTREPMADVGRDLGITRQRVCQLRQRALARLAAREDIAALAPDEGRPAAARRRSRPSPTTTLHRVV